MTKLFSRLFFIFIFLAANSAAMTAYAETFNYSGYLESDSKRSATMNLSVSGQAVTGNLSLQPVCQSNARLPGAEFNFSGELNGQWEGKGSVSGTWTGMVRWCDRDENRSGSFGISAGQGSVIFSGNGSYYNRYIFSPTGKVIASPATFSSPGPGQKGDAPVTAYGSFSPPPFRSGFGISADWMKNFFGVVEMSMNETRLFTVPLGGSWYRGSDMKLIESFADCYDAAYAPEPGSLLRDIGKVGDGVNIKATGEGVGKVWGNKSCYDCTFAGGEKGKCRPQGVWLVVVGNKGLKEYEDFIGKKKPTIPDSGPEPDIAKAVVVGKVVMVNSKKAVPGAQISLIAKEGGVYSRDNWKSNSEGAFNIQANNMLLSGVYEVMAQKRSADMGTAEDPFTVYKDLWPIKKYFVTIRKDSAKKGSFNVGDIEMDTVDNIFNKGNGRDKSENRTPVAKDSPSKQPASGVKSTSSEYNPLADPNLINPASRTHTDAAAVDKLGNDFQDQSNKTKDPDRDSQQPPISQPDSYTGNMKSQNNTDMNNDLPSSGYPQHSSIRTGNIYTKGTDTRGWSSARGCDEAQKQSAYRAGIQCGNKAKQNRGTITGDCSSAHRTYRNIDSKTGWGTCLAGAFDDGYRGGLSQISSSSASSTARTNPKITAELENKAGENVHIFVGGQDNFGPQNKLGPGQKRTLSLNISSGQSLKFVAGRNGQVLAQCNWTAAPGSSTASVRFSGSSTLTCSSK